MKKFLHPPLEKNEVRSKTAGRVGYGTSRANPRPRVFGKERTVAKGKLSTMRMEDIRPYPNNPRKNDGAVDAVAESIEQCGYIAPIIVDEDGVILAGHTRYKALKKLGYTEVDCVVKTGLTEEQKRKYRLLDNKTGELAEWDVDLLEMELDGLDFGSLDLDWGISSAEGLDLDEAASTQSEEEETETIHCPKCGFEFAV